MSAAFASIERVLAPHAQSVTQLAPNDMLFRAKPISTNDGRNPLPSRGRVHLQANGNAIAVELLQDRYHLWFPPAAIAAVLVAASRTWLAGVCTLGVAIGLGALASSYDRFAVRQMVRHAISLAATEASQTTTTAEARAKNLRPWTW